MSSGPTPVVKTASFPYAETLARLSAAIEAGGNTVFATIDQSRAAAGAGLHLRPTALIVFGNPAGGTPLMADFPLLALDLPLKLLVWDDEGRVSVAYEPMTEIARRYGVTGKDAQVAAMDRLLDTLTESVV